MLTTMLWHAHARGALGEALAQVREASRNLPTFTSADPAVPRPLLVSEGDEVPRLIFVPSFLVGSGPHQFARMAASFTRRSRASALVLPGFDRTGKVPATWDAALAALALAVETATQGKPFALVGYSIGGTIAHALASRLEATGCAPVGIVMIDTIHPEAADRAAAFAWALGSVVERDREGRLISARGLLAMGAYLRIFDEWTPDRVDVPTLMLSAEATAWPKWPVADSVSVVAADHFSILDEHAETTAKLIEGWLPR
ncbi:alpha/beta fold hydrolase [Nocardia sp. CDC159]|uniref:Alpha/beta fold hydrolase n=1 Tax=Nocardia pulmonis TaxID=2951408 RepID=A0A9X2EEJ0_9NOCA|nr:MULTISPECIES: alpha/beta fold hydrolase [Nocardia]MCM6778880.1 alpha/beta fold hydrolase [Nocardia pulmonis]MCM6791769.1 alpha/beta fold hydrolase [Nocardia sp. CDC159]